MTFGDAMPMATTKHVDAVTTPTLLLAQLCHMGHIVKALSG